MAQNNETYSVDGNTGERKCTSWKNQVGVTLPPKYRLLVEGYKEINEMRKSEAICLMVRSFFDNMPTEERQRFIRKSKNGY